MKVYSLTDTKITDYCVKAIRTRYFLFNRFVKKEKNKKQTEIRNEWLEEFGPSNLWEIHEKEKWTVSVPGEDTTYMEKLEIHMHKFSFAEAIRKIFRKEDIIWKS